MPIRRATATAGCSGPVAASKIDVDSSSSGSGWRQLKKLALPRSLSVSYLCSHYRLALSLSLCFCSLCVRKCCAACRKSFQLTRTLYVYVRVMRVSRSARVCVPIGVTTGAVDGTAIQLIALST